MNKVEGEFIKTLAAYLGGRFEKAPETRDGILQIVNTCNDNHILCSGNKMWSRSVILKAIHALSEEAINAALDCLRGLIKTNKRDVHLSDQLLGYLRVAFPDEDFDIVGFVYLGRNTYRIKIYMCGTTYILDFTGSIEKFAEALKDEVRHARNLIVKCPYCGSERPRHHWHDHASCRCGANIYMEGSKTRRGGMFLASDLAKEMMAVGAISVGFGNGIYEMWFHHPGRPPLERKMPTQNEGEKGKAVEEACGEIIIDGLTKEQIRELIEGAVECFAEWIIEGHHAELINGELVETEWTKDGKLALYGTLNEWLDGFNGSSRPFGGNETFRDEIQEFVDHSLTEILTKDMTDDQRCEFLDKDGGWRLMEMQENVMKVIGTISAKEAWRKGEIAASNNIERQRAEDKRLAEEAEKRRNVVSGIWTRYLPDVPKKLRIEKPTSKEFLVRLRRILAVSEDEEVITVAKEGLGGNFSNSVANEVGVIVKEECAKRGITLWKKGLS